MISEAKSLIRRIEAAGHEARIAGGFVRDFVAGMEAKDIDIATTATPEQVKEIFDHTHDTGLKHGTITVIHDSVPFEVTTLRQDIETDGRRAVVEFTDDWKVDAARRDFTFNAMFMTANEEIIDFFGGREDLKNNIVRFVGDAESRIKEDYLRIYRYFRFLSRLPNPQRDEETLSVIRRNKSGLYFISGERIWAELLKIFSSNQIPAILKLMHEAEIDPFEIGYLRPVDSTHMERFMARSNTIQAVTSDPIYRIIYTYENHAHLWGLMKHTFHVSRDEIKKLNDFHALFNMKDKLPEEDLFDCLWRLKTDVDFQNAKEIAAFLSVIHENMWPLHHAFSYMDGPKKWPITGADLIAEGFPAGPNFGVELRERNRRWFEDGYDEVHQNRHTGK